MRPRPCLLAAPAAPGQPAACAPGPPPASLGRPRWAPSDLTGGKPGMARPRAAGQANKLAGTRYGSPAQQRVEACQGGWGGEGRQAGLARRHAPTNTVALVSPWKPSRYSVTSMFTRSPSCRGRRLGRPWHTHCRRRRRAWRSRHREVTAENQAAGAPPPPPRGGGGGGGGGGGAVFKAARLQRPHAAGAGA